MWRLGLAHELLHNKARCIYTDPNLNSQRWNWHNESTLTFPFESDCSGTETSLNYFSDCSDPSDIDFYPGNTKTMLHNAYAKKLIIPKAQALHCDFVFFGPHADGDTPDHVVSLLQPGTMKNPLCFSMGSSRDPSADPLSVLLGIGAPTYVRNVTRNRNFVSRSRS